LISIIKIALLSLGRVYEIALRPRTGFFLHCLLIVLCVPTIRAEDGNGLSIRLYVREVSLTVLGKQAKVLVIEQDSGVQGFEPQTSSGFNVEVINQLREPTSIHWHGLVLPALMDGVPFVSQEPIPPNGKFHYQFPLRQSGTYWMHSVCKNNR